MAVISKINSQYSRLKSSINRDRHTKEIAKGGSVAFIVNLAGLGFGYLFIFLVSYIYKSNAAEIYGKYVLVTLILRIGSIITRFGTDTGMLQQTAGLASLNLWDNIKQINKKFLKLNFVFGSVVSVVLILLSGAWARLFKLDETTVAIAGFFVLPMALGLFYSQSLRGLKKIGISSFLQNSSLPTLNFFLLILLVPFFHSTTSGFKELPVITFYISVVITVILGFVFWKKATPAFSNSTFDIKRDKSYKELLKLSYPLLLAESMVFITMWVNQLMLGFLSSPKDVGVFNLCLKYAMLSSLPLRAITAIGAPKFSEFYFNRDREGLKNIVVNTTRMIFWISAPVVTLYILFPSFFLNLFGSSFTEGTTALEILAISFLINVMTGDTGALLQMTGKQSVLQNILFISLFVNICLNALLIPRLGITGTAITSLICSCINNFSMTWYIKKHYGFYSIYFPFLFNSKFVLKSRKKI